MSWAGEQARKDLMLAIGRDLAAETSRAVAMMLDCGVEHRDVRPPNVLWNPEIRNVVLVDFERSEDSEAVCQFFKRHRLTGRGSGSTPIGSIRMFKSYSNSTH